MTALPIPAEHEYTAEMSDAYAGPEYRATRTAAPSWTKGGGTRDYCAECASRQHETRGRFGPRMAPKHKRTLPNGKALLLCNRHAAAWQERDAEDTATTTKGTKR